MRPTTHSSTSKCDFSNILHSFQSVASNLYSVVGGLKATAVGPSNQKTQNIPVVCLRTATGFPISLAGLALEKTGQTIEYMTDYKSLSPQLISKGVGVPLSKVGRGVRRIGQEVGGSTIANAPLIGGIGATGLSECKQGAQNVATFAGAAVTASVAGAIKCTSVGLGVTGSFVGALRLPAGKVRGSVLSGSGRDYVVSVAETAASCCFNVGQGLGNLAKSSTYSKPLVPLAIGIGHGASIAGGLTTLSVGALGVAAVTGLSIVPCAGSGALWVARGTFDFSIRQLYKTDIMQFIARDPVSRSLAQ